MRISLVKGDITAQQVDAIVNAANSSLLGGGGVDGAIHRRGGPAVLAECRQLRDTSYADGLPTGEAVATTAGNLPAEHVIHTVGPMYSQQEDRTALLRSCYQRSLAVADEVGAQSVAFPLISSGVYRWPVDDAVSTAVETMRDTMSRVSQARLVLFDDDTFARAGSTYPDLPS